MKLDINKIKKDFSLFKTNTDLVYLDSAASSQTPDVVLDAMNEYYKNYRANIHRGLYDLSETASKKYEEARGIVADFLGAASDEIIFTDGATTAINMLVYSLEQSLSWEEGDEIVTSIAEHHSTLIPLQEFAKRKKLTLKHIPTTDTYDLDYEKASELITDKTKLAAIGHASNVLGTVHDIKKISDMAHGVGALVVVDAAKTVGHIEVDIKKLDCDFLYFSGHKMCGPTGIGVLYGKKNVLSTLQPSFFGGGIVEDVDTHKATFRDAPICFEPGTRNIAGAIGLAAAIKYVENTGLRNIHEHIQETLSYAYEKLGSLSGVTIFSQRDIEKNAGIISFIVDRVHPHDIGEILNRDNIAVRAGHHCAQPLMRALGVASVVRVSFYIYNGKEDIDRLVGAIKKAQKIFA